MRTLAAPISAPATGAPPAVTVQVITDWINNSARRNTHTSTNVFECGAHIERAADGVGVRALNAQGCGWPAVRDWRGQGQRHGERRVERDAEETGAVSRSSHGSHDRCRRAERDADTNCRDDEVDLGVVAVLKLIVPAIEHLQDWSADANRQDHTGDEPAKVHHRAAMITRNKESVRRERLEM